MRATHSGHDRTGYRAATVIVLLLLLFAAISVPAFLAAGTSEVLRAAALIALAIVVATVFTRLIDLWREVLQARAETLGAIGAARKDAAAAREVLARLRRR